MNQVRLDHGRNGEGLVIDELPRWLEEAAEICQDEGHVFEVQAKVRSRKYEWSRQPKRVRCTRCRRVWPVIGKDSWIPVKDRLDKGP